MSYKKTTTAENTLSQAFEDILVKYGFNSLNEIFAKAGLESSRKSWYNRINSNTAKASHIDKLLNGLWLTSEIKLDPEDISKLFESVGAKNYKFTYAERPTEVTTNQAEIPSEVPTEVTTNQAEISVEPVQDQTKDISQNVLTEVAETPIEESQPPKETKERKSEKSEKPRKDKKVTRVGKTQLSIGIAVGIIIGVGIIVFLLIISSVPPYSGEPRLELVDVVVLNPISPKVNEDVSGVFKVKNVGDQDITIDALSLGVRLGTTWQDPDYGFPAVKNIHLQPGEIYTYQKVRSFTLPGNYFAEPNVYIKRKWGGISNYNRVWFTVTKF